MSQDTPLDRGHSPSVERVLPYVKNSRPHNTNRGASLRSSAGAECGAYMPLNPPKTMIEPRPSQMRSRKQVVGRKSAQQGRFAENSMVSSVGGFVGVHLQRELS